MFARVVSAAVLFAGVSAMGVAVFSENDAANVLSMPSAETADAVDFKVTSKGQAVYATTIECESIRKNGVRRISDQITGYAEDAFAQAGNMPVDAKTFADRLRIVAPYEVDTALGRCRLKLS